MRFVLTVFLLSLLTGGIFAASYQTGGFDELTTPVQSALDENSDLIRLGFNTSWTREAFLEPNLVAGAIVSVANAVRDEALPGAVFSFGHIEESETMPVAIGWRMIDPQPYPMQWDTAFDLGSLTGPLVVMPMLLSAQAGGELDLSKPIGEVVEEFADAEFGNITAQALLAAPDWQLRDCATELSPTKRTPEALFQAWRQRSQADCALRWNLLSLFYDRSMGSSAKLAFLQQLAEPLGMVNSARSCPPGWRVNAAAGGYSDWHRRMVWAEPSDPAAMILGEQSGTGGFFTQTDDLAILARGLLALSVMGAGEDGFTSQTLRAHLPILPHIAMKSESGTLISPRGWITETGSLFALWPETGHFAVLLTNGDHKGSARDQERLAHVVLAHMQLAVAAGLSFDREKDASKPLPIGNGLDRQDPLQQRGGIN